MFRLMRFNNCRQERNHHPQDTGHFHISSKFPQVPFWSTMHSPLPRGNYFLTRI